MEGKSKQYYQNVQASLRACQTNHSIEVNGQIYTQLNANTYTKRKAGANTEAQEYSFAYPRDMGSWGQAGSDGLIWIGCMSCRADKGAYRYAAYNSAEHLQGMWIAALLERGAGAIMGPARGTVRLQ